jgi:glucosamine-6-phosphate deaminase
MVRVVVCASAEECGSAAAAIIADAMRSPASSTGPVLGLATGSTPIPTYRALARMVAAGALSFATTRTFNLDEYRGLPASHPQSYRAFMDAELFDRVDIPKAATRVLDGMASAPDAECAAFEAEIAAAGGVDVWLLGIGNNGHIAFNEPGSSFTSRTRVVPLAPSTITANARFFEGSEAAVPTEALSAGIGTILGARAVVLVATGKNKAAAVRAALLEDPTEAVPASALQGHPCVTFVLDTEAAAELPPTAPYV